MKIKDVIGPTMVGPSSSHTAGAIRIGNIAYYIYGRQPSNMHFTLYNSFAKTGLGHGTDKALIGGCLGFLVDDIRIRDSYSEAKDRGIQVGFSFKTDRSRHPNSVDIEFQDGNSILTVSANSTGAGNIQVIKINDFNVDLRGDYYSLILFYKDQPGMIWKVTKFVQANGVNIESLICNRLEDTDDSMMCLCLAHSLDQKTLLSIKDIDNIFMARTVPALEK